MKTDFQLALICASAVSLTIVGCDSGGGDTTEGGGTMATSGADTDPTNGDNPTTSADGTASDTMAADDSSTGPVDPTEGEEPPTFNCDGGGVYPTDVIIEPEEAQGAHTPIEMLDGISIIEGNLLINSVNYFNLGFLECITEVHGDVQIFGNPFLSDLSGTDNMTKVGRLPRPLASDPTTNDLGKGTITISDNPALVELNGFASVAQIGEQDAKTDELSPQSLVIRNNDALQTITGFNSLALIFESLIIQENNALLDIDGLKGLQGIGGAFSVSRNDSLCISSVICVGDGLMTFDPENSTMTQNDEGC